MQTRKLCPGCTGRGTCWFCNGTGTRYVAINHTTLSDTCSPCEGRGACAECQGRGYIEQKIGESCS